MNKENLIKKIENFAKEVLKNAESGHDFFHSLRVKNLAKTIAEKEAYSDVLALEIAAIVHDIADHKFVSTKNSGIKIIKDFFYEQNLDENTINRVIFLTENVSFSSENKIINKELEILQDADRLDAIGAIGIARAFSYGGFKQRPFFDPEEKPKLNLTKQEYKKHKSTTINHFYEKLLTLKDGMHTQTGKKIAEQRHAFMLEFLQKFTLEWEGIE